MLLGIGKRAVLHQPLAAPHAHCRAHLRRQQPMAVDDQASAVQGADVDPPRRHIGSGDRRVAAAGKFGKR